MASLKKLTREAVEQALAEFDAIGRDAFLAKYQFGSAKGLYLIRDGKRYDSKAIAGAAMGRVPGHVPLRPADFTGGVATVVRTLERLGFEVIDERPPRNPKWAPEEIILALEVYLIHGPLEAADQRVCQLSQDLNALDVHPERPDAERWRNVNGAAMKLANFAHFDPGYPGKGLDAGSKLDRRLWDLLSPYPDAVNRLALQVKAGMRVEVGALAGSLQPGPGIRKGPAASPAVTTKQGPVEAHHTRGKYEVALSTEPRTAERVEQPLVLEFCEFLAEAGYSHGRTSYAVDGAWHQTDLVVQPVRLLFEAKFGTDRPSVRMAVGQLEDYDFMEFEESGARYADRAVLLGRRPSASVLRLLDSLSFGAAWPTERGWAASGRVASRLTQCRWAELVP